MQDRRVERSRSTDSIKLPQRHPFGDAATLSTYRCSKVHAGVTQHISEDGEIPFAAAHMAGSCCILVWPVYNLACLVTRD